ncbi:MAG: tRNA pseudouridine(38-40) synthase TruA [Actinobacteria bacterium]|nr:tRNA pseudouridine(38-40) synthase TruA [Actinomycetota bacterium]
MSEAYDVERRIIRLVVAYDGTSFRGWAAQADPALRTVERLMVDALALVTGERPSLSVAGRTDAGVHARGQVVSFPTSAVSEPERISLAVNSMLGPEVVVRDAGYAPPGFDARFSASARVYRYRIDEGAVADPFRARFVWHRPGRVALAPMRAAARALVGEHDFAAFCRQPGGGRSTKRRLQHLTVDREGDRLALGFRANAFCHQMVRSLVGTLVAVGDGSIDPGGIPDLLGSTERAASGRLAPAHGLTLERVVYGRRL